MDATIVATHMILEAANLEIDSTWLEMFDAKILKKEFELDKNMEPICIINLGYKSNDCSNNPFHNVRKNIEEIVKYV